MAIKGKNRSKSRSGRPRSRPSASARPVTTRPSQHVPWHKTMAGQLTAIIAVLALIGTGIWFFSARSARAAELEAQQEELRAFTSEIEPIVSSVQQTLAEMLGAPFNTADPEAIADLEEGANRWAEDLEAAAALSEGLVAPEGSLEPATQMIQQGMMLYRSAALTYQLVPSEEGPVRQQKLIDRATDQRDAAGRVLGAGINALDLERQEVDLSDSQIPNPATLAPIVPTPDATVSGAPERKSEKRSGKKNGSRDSDG